MAGKFKFTFGPWNIHQGADPFGPMVRKEVAFGKKLKMYKKLGFDGVQFHDDDAVPDMNALSNEQIVKKAALLSKQLKSEGLLRNLSRRGFGKMHAPSMAATQTTTRRTESMQSSEANEQLILLMHWGLI